MLLLHTDDLIKQQQKQKSIHKGGVSNADRSTATSRAKRDAAVAARRGLRSSAKPTKMEIETAVKKQANQTAIQKANHQQNATKKTTTDPKEKAEARKEQRQIAKAGKQAAKEEHVALKPTQKQIKAARKAMIEAGYQFPPKHQISIVPVAATTNTNQRTQQKQQQQPKGKGGGGGGGANKQNTQQQQQQQQQPKKNNRRGGGGGGKKK